MFLRIMKRGLITGAAMVGPLLTPVLAGSMGPEEARAFVAGKLFAFTCFDGTRGAGRIQSDGSVAGTVQFGGSGPTRYARLPANTIQVRSNAVCASLKGLPFEPCFNLDKTDEVSFRGSVAGMGFAYCEFHKHGNSIIMARARARPRSLHPPRATRSADASTVQAVKTEPVKSEPLAELRRSQD
jgi:hypothetical protein